MCYTQPDSARGKSLAYENRAWEAYQAQRFETAISILDSSIALDSSRPSPFILKSEALWFIGRFAEAAETYKKWIIIELLTDSSILLVGAYVHLGMLYDKADMFIQAKEQYIKAINTFESDYKAIKQFEGEEEVEYVMAFGLLGDSKNWKKKLMPLVEKYKLWDLSKLENVTRKQLLETRFAPYTLNGG